MPGSHKDFAFNSLLLLYYTQIVGVSATLTSAVLAIALIIDAVTDPMVGAFSDNLKTRLGRRHPLMYVAAVPLGLMMSLLFMPPDGLGDTGAVIWLFCMVIGVHLSFTFFVVPWNALAAELSSDYVERTSIVAYRHLMGWIFGPIFAFSVISLVFAGNEAYPQGQLNPDNYPPFAIVVGLLVTTWVLITTHLTRDQVPFLLQPEKRARTSVTEIAGQCMLALKSRNYRLVVVGYLTFMGITGITGVFDSFMNTYFWQMTGEDLRWFSLTLIGAISAVVLSGWLQAKFEKHHLLLAGLFGTMLLSMGKVALRFADWLPENGETMLIVVLITQDALIAFCMTVGGIMFASMIGDLVDEQEIDTGRRQEGVFASVLGFASKASSSVGLIIGGLMLDNFIGFPKGVGIAEIDPDILFRLAIADGMLVNVFILVPVIMLFGYSLTRDRLVNIQQQLNERRLAQTVQQE